MSISSGPLRHALTWAEVAVGARAAAWVTALFVAAVWLARAYATPIQDLLSANARLGLLVFVASSAVAVLIPVLTNLPLVPLAVLAWGPWWTAGLLLLGWVAGAALSFVLGRHARAWVLRHFPSVERHANIDRLIHPQPPLVVARAAADDVSGGRSVVFAGFVQPQHHLDRERHLHLAGRRAFRAAVRAVPELFHRRAIGRLRWLGTRVRRPRPVGVAPPFRGPT